MDNGEIRPSCGILCFCLYARPVMDTLLSFIQHYGYLAIFAWTLLEGETIVALGGFVAHQGHLKLELVLVIAMIGATIGDSMYFYFGRWKGRDWLLARPRLADRAARIHLLIERHQYWLIFGSRFLYGFRTIIPIAIGTSRVSPWTFFALNFAGAVVWAIVFVFGGYLFGQAVEQFLGQMHRAGKYVVAGVLLGFLLVHLILFVRSRIIARVEKAERKLEEQTLEGRK